MDAEYLKQNVGSALADGLVSVVTYQPSDPVEYLGHWLLKFVESQENKLKEEKEKKKFEDQLKQWKNAKQQQEKLQEEKEKQLSVEEKERANFIQRLHSARNIGELLTLFVNGIQSIVNASGVYVAALESVGENKRLRYVAATKEDHFLVDDYLEAGKGVTLDLFQEAAKESEQQEDAPTDDEQAAQKKKEQEEAKKLAKEEIKMINIPNVLLGPLYSRIHFHRLPKVGAYCATRIQYSTALTEEVIEASVEQRKILKKQEEKKAEQRPQSPVIHADHTNKSTEAGSPKHRPSSPQTQAHPASPQTHPASPQSRPASPQTHPASPQSQAPPTPAPTTTVSEFEQITKGLSLKTSQYAICFDTLGQSRAFTAGQIEHIKQFSKVLQQAIEKLDHDLLVEQVEKRIRLSLCKEIQKNEEEMARETEELKAHVDAAAKPEDLQFARRKLRALAPREMLLEFASFEVFTGPIAIFQGLLLLLDYPHQQMADKNKKPVWSKIRQLLNTELLEKINKFQPRIQAERHPTQEAEKLKAVVACIEGHTIEDIKDKNYPLAEILGFVKEALDVYKIVTIEKEKRLQEERERKEKEEAEKKAAEAAAIAAAAAAATAAVASAGDTTEENPEEFQAQE